MAVQWFVTGSDSHAVLPFTSESWRPIGTLAGAIVGFHAVGGTP